MGFISFKEFWL